MRLSHHVLIYFYLLLVYAGLVFLTYVLFPLQQISMGQVLPAELMATPAWQLGALNAAMALFGYGLLGLAGYWFARQLKMPGIYRVGASWPVLLWQPFYWGLGLGLLAVVVDGLFASLTGSDTRFAHPGFPLSLFASATAGLGEEILFRGFVLGLWGWLLWRLLGRRHVQWVFWFANAMAALLFSLGHIPSVMLILGLERVSDIPLPLFIEGLLLNGGLALVAGWRYRRDGLVAAIGVHFWFDVVWHVLWPLLA